VELY